MSSCLPLAAIETDVFPDSYASGRQRWLGQLARLPSAIQPVAYSCAGAGPEGEALVTDTVWIGEPEASRVVIVIAGTHGIEGFAGSAVESDHLRLIADGCSNAEIGRKLYIAIGTVKRHINNIYGKLGTESRTQAVARARQLGLL